MTVYDEDFIKQIMEFRALLKSHQYERVKNASNSEEFVSEMKSFIVDLTTSVEALYIVIGNEMKETNRIRDIIAKLPDSEEFKELKQELEAQKNNTIETLLPIKKLAEAIQESKNKKVGYIV